MQDTLITFLFCAHSILPLFIIVSCIFFFLHLLVFILFLNYIQNCLDTPLIHSHTPGLPALGWSPVGSLRPALIQRSCSLGCCPDVISKSPSVSPLRCFLFPSFSGAFPSEASPLPWWIIFFSSFQRNEVWDRKVWSSCMNASLQSIPMFNEKFVEINLEE